MYLIYLFYGRFFSSRVLLITGRAEKEAKVFHSTAQIFSISFLITFQMHILVPAFRTNTLQTTPVIHLSGGKKPF